MDGAMDNSDYSLSEDKQYFNSALAKWNARDYRSALSDCNNNWSSITHGQSIRLKGMLHYSLTFIARVASETIEPTCLLGTFWT